MARLHILPVIGHLPLQSVRPKDVRDLYAKLRREGSEGGRGPLGKSSLHNVHTTLHGALSYAIEREQLRRNPADRAEPRMEDDDDGVVEFWTPKQVGAFLDHVDGATSQHVAREERRRKGKPYPYLRRVDADPMLRALLYVCVATGARRGEVCGVQWSDVDLASGHFTIRRGHVMVGGEVVESKTKTKRGRRAVLLDADTVAALREWRAQQEEERRRYAGRWEDADDHVFTHGVYLSRPVRYGVLVRPDWVTSRFRRMAIEADLPALRLHGLRHSWATTAHLNGIGLRVIADQLGHADTSVTDRTYTATLLSVQEHAAALVAQSIKRARGGAAERSGTESGQRDTLREVS